MTNNIERDMSIAGCSVFRDAYKMLEKSIVGCWWNRDITVEV